MYLIDEYETSESFSVMLGAIARKTGNLEEVWPKGPKVHIDALYALSETNMHLRNVSVRSAVPYGEDQNSYFYSRHDRDVAVTLKMQDSVRAFS